MDELAIITDGQIIIQNTEQLTLAAIKPVVEQYVAINASMVFDYRSKEGNKAARSHVAMLRKVKAPITDAHKRLKADLKAQTDAMDKEKRELLEVVEVMIEHHSVVLDQIAEEEKAEAILKENQANIDLCWDHAHELNAMVDQQRELARQAEAQAKIAEAQAEAQRKIDQAEREKRIAEEAAETARINAEAKAESDRKAAVERERLAAELAAKALKDVEEKAAREKAEAEQRHLREIEAERKRAKEEEDRKVAEAKRAAEDLENVKRVNRSILASMVVFGIGEDAAKVFIVAVKNGEVPCMAIDYSAATLEMATE